MESAARLAYEAYWLALGGVDSVGYAMMPTFDRLPSREREAWVAAVAAIALYRVQKKAP